MLIVYTPYRTGWMKAKDVHACKEMFCLHFGVFFVCLVFVVLLIVTAEVTGRPYLATCMYVCIHTWQ